MCVDGRFSQIWSQMLFIDCLLVWSNCCQLVENGDDMLIWKPDPSEVKLINFVHLYISFVIRL